VAAAYFSRSRDRRRRRRAAAALAQALEALSAAGRINYLGIFLERWTEAGLTATAMGHLQKARKPWGVR
jgi:hypothetical protein